MAGEIRQGFDTAALEKYLEQHDISPTVIQTPLQQVKQFGLGQSNPTYQLTAKNGTRFVLRKKPPGSLLSKKAHQVDREYRVLRALQDTDVPVPKTICLCQDEGIIGTPFYIMEFLDGRIFEKPALPGVSAGERTEIWKSAVETLAKLHRLDPDSLGLGDFGGGGGGGGKSKKSVDFYARQIKTFSSIHASQSQTPDKSKGGKPIGGIPHHKELSRFFEEEVSRRPAAGRVSIVHGDFKIDNLVFHKTEPRVIGVLDWEMSTTGHPLSDLCQLLMPHTITSSSFADKITHHAFTLLLLPFSSPFSSSSSSSSSSFQEPPKGTPSKSHLIQRYSSIIVVAAGENSSSSPSVFFLPPQDLAWAEAFTFYRGAVIMQGITARQAMGSASGASSGGEYAGLYVPFAEVAWRLVRGIREGEEEEEKRQKKMKKKKKEEEGGEVAKL